MGMSPATLTPRRRGAAPWTPLELSNLVAWFDPSYGVYNDAGSTPANVNDPCYRWVARFPLDGSIYAEQSTLDKRQIWRRAPNGFYYFAPDGTNDAMTAVLNLATPWTVGQNISIGTAGRSLGFGFNSLLGGYGTGLGFYLESGFIYSAAASGWNRIIATSATGDRHFYKNGTDVASSPTTGTDITLGNVSFGGEAGITEYSNHLATHIVFCSGVMPADEIALLDEFLLSQTPNA